MTGRLIALAATMIAVAFGVSYGIGKATSGGVALEGSDGAAIDAYSTSESSRKRLSAARASSTDRAGVSCKR